MHTRPSTAELLTCVDWLLLSRDPCTALGRLVPDTEALRKWQGAAGTGGSSPSPLLSRLPGYASRGSWRGLPSTKFREGSIIYQIKIAAPCLSSFLPSLTTPLQPPSSGLLGILPLHPGPAPRVGGETLPCFQGPRLSTPSPPYPRPGQAH